MAEAAKARGPRCRHWFPLPRPSEGAAFTYISHRSLVHIRGQHEDPDGDAVNIGEYVTVERHHFGVYVDAPAGSMFNVACELGAMFGLQTATRGIRTQVGRKLINGYELTESGQ